MPASDYLVRLVQVHEAFRRAELDALAVLADTALEIVEYSDDSPFCIVRLPSEADAARFVSRAILSHAIYELWASATCYEELHDKIRDCSLATRPAYRECSFRFELDSYRGKRDMQERRNIIEAFAFLDFKGPIVMKDPDLRLAIFEFFQMNTPKPDKIFFGRWVADSDRHAIVKYNLKKRCYINTTSMDAELSLINANLLLAAPGKVVYDPFVGTGSLSVACAHFGAATLGSDIDGRSLRGSSGRNLLSNYAQYNVQSRLLDSFVADVTNSPVRKARWIDGIVCDPPYGIREGPKVLGYKDGAPASPRMVDGVPAHARAGYVPPKRQYDFDDMMADILEAGYELLVDGGRLTMWMPTANDEDIDLPLPEHPGLELLSACTQDFNKWSRRLLTYRRLPGMLSEDSLVARGPRKAAGKADDLNRFRKKYFEGFKSKSDVSRSELGQ